MDNITLIQPHFWRGREGKGREGRIFTWGSVGSVFRSHLSTLCLIGGRIVGQWTRSNSSYPGQQASSSLLSAERRGSLVMYYYSGHLKSKI